jgi:hypothetical protein
MYKQHVNTINSANDLLRQAFDKELVLSDKESFDKLKEEKEHEEYKFG